MNNNGNKSLEEEFRSSQVYKTISGIGVPVADKIAQGLGKAVEGIDHALNSAAPAGKRGANGTIPYRQDPSQGTSGQGSQGAAQPQNGGQYRYHYNYHYNYPAGNQAPRTAQTARTYQTTQTVGQTPQAQTAHPGRRPQGVEPAPAPQMPQMKMVRRGSPVKFYATALAALLYAWNFPLYETSHFIVFALVLCGVFLLSGRLFRGKKEFVPVEPEKPKKEEKKEAPKEEPQKTTGNPEVDKIVSEGSVYLKKLRAANDAIPDEALTEDITRMEKASADIFRFISDHPEKAPQIRKFMNYYLPTTLKLLNSYQRLSAQSAKGENITSTMFNIAGMMHTVADAFEKQLDSLFTDEAMDVSADISVFETLLKQEGFVEDEKKPQTKNQEK